MAIILKNEVIDPNKQKIVEIVETKATATTAVTAVKKDGTIAKKYSYKLFINNEEIEMNDNIVALINNLITKI